MMLFIKHYKCGLLEKYEKQLREQLNTNEDNDGQEENYLTGITVSYLELDELQNRQIKRLQDQMVDIHYSKKKVFILDHDVFSKNEPTAMNITNTVIKKRKPNFRKDLRRNNFTVDSKNGSTTPKDTSIHAVHIDEIAHLNNESSKHVFTSEEEQQVLNGELEEDNNMLLDYIRQKYLILSPNRSYNVRPIHILDASPNSEASFVDKCFNEKRNGIFVELQAGNGETDSTTLFLERKRGWTGLLTEKDITHFTQLRNKNRYACLANIYIKGISTKRQSAKGKQHFTNGTNLPASFSFLSVLLAANITKVDYLSFGDVTDVIEILKSLPQNKIQIEMMSMNIENELLAEAEDYEKHKRHNRKIREYFKASHDFRQMGVMLSRKTIGGAVLFFRNIMN